LKERLFIKIGGSFLTDKTTADSLNEPHVRKIAQAISDSLNESQYELVLAHGAGAYGHIQAKFYNARQGIHPVHGWEGFYKIRQDMMLMNLRFVKICAENKLFPITIQPSAILFARNGEIVSLQAEIIKKLLQSRQIPLLHGDIVYDDQQGFTIASTEDILSTLSSKIYFDRVIMISDVPGILDTEGNVIPEINEQSFENVVGFLSGARGADVTGGMKNKVEQLYKLIRSGVIKEALIISGNSDPLAIKEAILGSTKIGTIIK